MGRENPLVDVVLSAVSAKGCAQFSDVVSLTGLDRRRLSVLLAKLVKTGVVAKTVKGYVLAHHKIT